jgi:hypothetical protein
MAKKKSRVGKAVTYKEFKKQNMPVVEVYASGRPMAKMKAGAAKNRGEQSPLVDAPKKPVIEAGMGGARAAAVKAARALARKLKRPRKAGKVTEKSAGIGYDELGRMSNDQLVKRLDEAISWSKKNNKSLNTDKDIAAQFKTLTGQSIKDLKSGKFDMNKRVLDSKGAEIPVMGDKAKDGLYEVINLLRGVM